MKPFFFCFVLFFFGSCHRKEAIEMEGTYNCSVIIHNWSELNGYGNGTTDTIAQNLTVYRSKFNNLEVNGHHFEAWSLRDGKTSYSYDSLGSGFLSIRDDSISYVENESFNNGLDTYYTEKRYVGKKN